MKILRSFLLGATLLLSGVLLADEAQIIDQTAVTKRIESKDANLVVLDVRTPEEFAAGHLPGARNIPHDQLADRLGELAGAKDKDVVVYCRSGRRSAMALDTLSKNGFKHPLHLE